MDWQLRAIPGVLAKLTQRVLVITGSLAVMLDAGSVPTSAQTRSTIQNEQDVFSLPKADFLSRLFVEVRGEDRTPGWYLIPSITLSEEYDDNIFSTGTRRTSDFISRFYGGMSASYLSDRARLTATYSVGSELFADHSELNDAAARQLGGIDLQYATTRRATLGLNASFSSDKGISQAVQETGVVGVEVGRREVSVVRASPFTSYQFDALTSGELRYDFARSDVAGGSVDTRHQAELTATRQFTPLDRAMLTYTVAFFESEKGEPLTSHTVRPGYARLLTSNTSVTLEAGPRFTDGDVNLDVRAGFAHRLTFASVSLGYTRTQDIVVGLAGARATDTVTGFVELSPLRPVRVSFGSSVSKISGAQKNGDGSDTTAYSANALVSYPLTSWLVARLGYRFSLQENMQSIARHVATLSVEFRYPVRVRGRPVQE